MTRRGTTTDPRRTKLRARAAVSALAALALTVTGCGSAVQHGRSAASASASTHEAGLTVAVKIFGGVVTPRNARYDAAVGKAITLVVTSDVADEIHVHSTPDHTFAVAAAAGQRFTFAVTVPGSVSIELHEAGAEVAKIRVS